MPSSAKFACALSLCIGACSFDGNANTGGGTNEDRDGGPVDFDAANDSVAPDNLHLLLSEVKNSPSRCEFIEIYNPTDSDISLDNYYLADNGQYPFVPAASLVDRGFKPEEGSDFVVRFPPGHTISSKGVVVIGVQLDCNPDIVEISSQFHIGNSGPNAGQSMDEAYPESIRSQPTLTDQGESVILFHWDGFSNLVQDVDIILAGPAPSPKNQLPEKHRDSIIGPAGKGIGPINYVQESLSLPFMSAELEEGESYIRTALEGDNEHHLGIGNGLFGHDETSEDTTITWTIGDSTPGTTTLGQ